MALFKSLEIDTLKLRNLNIVNADNSLIPSSFHLYSRGDGTTYWSTGNTAQEFINLSTTVSTNHILTTRQIQSTNQIIVDTASSLQSGFNSSIMGISTFATNLNTYSTTLNYVDTQLGIYSTNMNTTLVNDYTTRATTSLLSTIVISLFLQGQANLQSSINILNAADAANKSSITDIFVETSTIYRNISTFEASTFAGYSSLISTNYGSTQQTILSSIYYLKSYTDLAAANLTTQLNTVNNSLASSITNTNNTLYTLTTNLANQIQSTFYSSLGYTDRSIGNLYASTQVLVLANNATINNNLYTASSTITSSVSGSNSNTLSSVSTSVGTLQSTNLYLMNNLALLTSTGLTTNIYKTFIQLESYSAGIVESTVSSANLQLGSTINLYTYIYNSTINQINISSFAYLVATAYASSLGVLIPTTQSTLASTIAGEVSSFNSTTRNLTFIFNSSIIAINSTNLASASTLNGQGISSQYSVLSTSLAALSTYGMEMFSTTTGAVSAAFFAQYLTSPSIIMHRTYNLSTLSNVSTITGYSSLTASIINLDITSYNNFYMLVSDISSDVYYGITYKTNAAQVNKEITLQIDMPSSYSNKFITIDTGNLTRWLSSSSKIYNQSQYGLESRKTPKIYLSTFLGVQLIQMRMMRDALYVKDIFTYPYIYTTLSLVAPITIQSNVQVSNTYAYLQNSTFVYKDTRIPIQWTTNDVNLKVGVKFVGTDLDGNNLIGWSGPYDASNLGAIVNAPNKSVFARYNTIQIGIYTSDDLDNSSDSANLNTPGQVFATQTLNPPIYVVTPTINSKITVYNPSTLNSYIEISEFNIINDTGENIMTTSANKYGSVVTNSSPPYQGDFNTWGPQRMTDGNTLTSFRGGIDANIVDKNAFVSVEISSFTNTFSPQTTLSSIIIYGSGNNNSIFTINGMKLKIENKNQPGIPDGLFYSTMTLTGFTPNIINF